MPLLTAFVFLLIQQLEGNFLMSRSQGQTLRLPSVVVFLPIIAGGEIAGLLGVIIRATRGRAEGTLRLLPHSAPHHKLA